MERMSAGAVRICNRGCKDLLFLPRGYSIVVPMKLRVRQSPTMLLPKMEARQPQKRMSHSDRRYTSLFPLPDVPLPPRIEHVIVRKSDTAAAAVSSALDLPPQYVKDLINFGAVYYSQTVPPPPPHAQPSVLAAFNRALQDSDALWRQRVPPKASDRRPKLGRVKSGQQMVQGGGYMRVHVHPKRFPRVYEVDWRKRIIANEVDYVVLDKPAGVPVCGSVDNLKEAATVCVANALGYREPLRVTHQIDNCTEGCVVLAKTKAFASSFNCLLQEGKVHKIYRALVVSPVKTGILVHYMLPTRTSPKTLSDDPHQGWLRCELEVLDCRPVPWLSPSLFHHVSANHQRSPGHTSAYECLVCLITGRTHQLRAQLAAVGSPLVGDTLYMPRGLAILQNEANREGCDEQQLAHNKQSNAPTLPSSETRPRPQPTKDSSSTMGWQPNDVVSLKYGGDAEPKGSNEVRDMCVGSRERVGESAEEDMVASIRAVQAHAREPEGAVGLQAFQLWWEDGVRFEAGSPWWGSDVTLGSG